MNSNNQYTMYGAEFSLYSGKTRSYLRKKGIPFKEVTSTISVYKKFIIPRTGVRYIPVVQTPDDQVFQDTTVIIDELEKRFPDHSVYPAGQKQKLISLLLEHYGDEWLLIPAMHYRWYYKAQNARFIYGEFGKMLLPKAPAFLQRMMGKKIGNKFKSAVSKLGVSESNRLAVEKSYETFLDDLNTHFTQHDYLLGSKPCIADFGFIAPLYAHLYRDPAPGELMRARAPAVVDWVQRMISDAPHLQTGSFVENDEIPDTLLPIIQRMVSEQLPVLLDTDRQLTAWRKNNPGTEEVARYIGTHKFTIEGVEGNRVIMPYSLWMYRRSIDYYQSIEPNKELMAFLDKLGLKDALSKGLENQLKRIDNKFCFE